jgi:hypothetical protein
VYREPHPVCQKVKLGNIGDGGRRDEEFGADSLNFKLYAFVYDLTKAGNTGNGAPLAIRVAAISSLNFC